MFNEEVTLFSLVNDKDIPNINSSEIRINIDIKDIDSIYESINKSISNVESINGIKFSDGEKDDITIKSLDLINFSLYSLSDHKIPYVTDLKEFYIDRYKIEDGEIVFTKGIYRGNRTNKEDIDKYFKEKVLKEGASVASMYCSLGRLQLRRMKKGVA